MMRRLSPVYLLAPVFLAFMICGGEPCARAPFSPIRFFFEANRFYKSEQYPQAIEAYEELVAAGILSGASFSIISANALYQNRNDRKGDLEL